MLAGLVLAIAALLLAPIGLLPAAAQTSGADLYEIKGVEVKVDDEDAAKAKVKALVEAQTKAFDKLVTRLVSAQGKPPEGTIPSSEIARAMAGMSIEEERTGPKTYIATVTVRFRPEAVQQILDKYKVSFSAERARTTLLLPVYKIGDRAVLWDSPNPWRDAWTAISPENSITPILLPLGDLTDTSALTAEDVLEGRAEKIDILKERYQVDHVLISVAEADAGKTSLTVRMYGISPIGQINWQESYDDPPGNVEGMALAAARRFFGAIEESWRAGQAQRPKAQSNVFVISIPFANIQEWQEIRRSLSETVGVNKIDISTLSGSGAIVSVDYDGTLDQFTSYLEEKRLVLSDGGSSLVLYRQ